jgi:hypothetical protein
MRLITFKIFGLVVFFLISAFGWSQGIKSFNHSSTQQEGTLPTLTMTEITPVNLSANIGNSDSQTLNVSAVNVSSGVNITLSGTNADQFSISQNNVAFSIDSVPDTVISVTYTPTTLGLHNATLTFSSAGASDVIRTITGVSGLDVPLANEPTSISTTGFTANWTAVNGATAYLLDVYTKPSGTTVAPDLIISEYVEGSSYNKAIELYNGTGSSVDLGNYSLRKQTNGAGNYSTEQILSGILASGQVFVSANKSANQNILTVADTINNSTMTFNGNDAIGLFKSGIQIDEVGVLNQTADWGKDVTLVRKASVISPKVPYDTGEWDSFACDYTDQLGTHRMQLVINNVAPITGSPFTVNGTNSYMLSGLTSGITYYYTVKAVNGTYNTDPSNEMSVNLLQTEWRNPQIEPVIIIKNGKIQIETHQVSTALMIFNGLGQMLISRSISEGLNIIPLAYRGVIFIKLGDKVTKGIL